MQLFYKYRLVKKTTFFTLTLLNLVTCLAMPTSFAQSSTPVYPKLQDLGCG